MSSHEEMVKSGSFDQKFKNTLRDYYSYGFKRYADFASSRSTVDADWTRLHNILEGYFEWSDDKGTAFFASMDSQSMPGNPFHRVYRFCRYNERDPFFFFHTILALSPAARLRDGAYALNLPVDSLLFRLEDDLTHGRPLSSAELACFYGNGAGQGEYNAVNKRLSELCGLGLLVLSGKRRNATNRWTLAVPTLRGLLSDGNAVRPDFAGRFRDALHFFAGSFPLGALGESLLRRMGPGEPSPFRFRHAYFAQSLNGCNLADLLYAVEHGLWCVISYRHGTANVSTVLAIFPFGIRTSTANGREYVAFYEPFQQSYSCLRLEFIDSVRYVRSTELTDPSSGRTVRLDSEEVRRGIDNARRSMAYSWGTATTKKQSGNAVQPAPKQLVRLRAAFDPVSEPFLLQRLRRECRIGSVTASGGCAAFEAAVSDEREMKPWLRSFYGRLLSVEGFHGDLLSGEPGSDIRHVWETLQNGLPERPPQPLPPTLPTWGGGVQANTVEPFAHKALFHELYSLYYQIWAEALFRLSSDPETECWSKAEVSRILREIFGRFGQESGKQTGHRLFTELQNALVSGGFLREGFRINGQWSAEAPKSSRAAVEPAFRPLYHISGESFLADVLPLTGLECRWLAAAVDDPRAGLFLSGPERDAVRAYLRHECPEPPRPLPFGEICCFDRHHLFKTGQARERQFFPPLLAAIREHRVVYIRYRTAQNNKVSGFFQPILLEYSQRDGIFRGFFRACSDGNVFVMNLSRLLELTPAEERFCPEETADALARFRSRHMRSVSVEFYDVHNTADRILTEFSPWQKECTYDQSTQKYRLTLSYQQSDEAEIIIRLLGYGANLAFCDRESPVCREVMRRVQRQLDLAAPPSPPPGKEK